MARRYLSAALAALVLAVSAPALAQTTCDLTGLQPDTAVTRVLRAFRETRDLGPKLELTYALSNDHRGIVSRYDARRILEAGIDAILASDDPQATYEANVKYINAARATLGFDVRARKILDKYTAAGQRAVYERDAMLNPSDLPLEARKGFFRMLSWQLDALDNVGDSKLKISDIDELGTDQFSFQYAFTGVADPSTKGTAYAIRYDGQWVFSPVKVSAADLDVVKADLRSHYREYFIADWDRNDPDYDQRVRDALSSLGPDNTVWPGGYGDPYGYTSDYPVVFEIGDPDGSDNAFYTGFNPDTGDVSTYDFN